MRRHQTRYDDIKHRLRQEIEQYIQQHCPKKDVLVFLSGGADSTLVALAAHHIGKRVRALSFRIGGVENPDCVQARKTSKVMGWNCHVLNVNTKHLDRTFIRLFETYGCRTKTEAGMSIFYSAAHQKGSRIRSFVSADGFWFIHPR